MRDYVRSKKLTLELNCAEKIRRSVGAAIEVPACERVAIGGRRVLSFGRPCNPAFTVRMNEQRHDWRALLKRIPMNTAVAERRDDVSTVARYGDRAHQC